MKQDWRLLSALSVIVLLGLVLDLAIGETQLPLGRLLAALTGGGEPLDRAIFWELRLPRALLAAAIGAGLGASGAGLQGFFRNPLADPGIVGISAGAGLGAIAAIYWGWSAAAPISVALAALLGAGAFGAILLAIAAAGASPTTLILAGVGLSTGATALAALALNFSPNPWALSELVRWQMGTLTDSSWSEASYALPLIAGGVALVLFCGPGLRALSLGEDVAASLGINLKHLAFLLLFGVLLAVGAGVAAAGSIAFVGLAAPHLVRASVNWDPARTIFPAALAGAVMILFADLASKLISGAGTPLYLGVFTSLFGAPLFIWVVFRNGARR